MSAVRMFGIFISLLALLVMTFYVGCSPDRSGEAAPNQKPIVYFVNTPPDSAQFSRNPDLNWYATDIDGYIKFYRYAVIVDSMMLIGGNHVTPDIFAEQATDQQFGWDTLEVDLDNTQTSATIRLFANVDFPIDSFVTQYFFIQACDDRDALSDIIWRMYSRNNHFPNTHFRASSYYINAPDPASPAPGISLTWEGADSTDWGRAEPPLEYEWRLYGPFERDQIIPVNLVKENCIYDPTVDSLVNCIDVPVVDLDNLPPAVQNMPQPLLHSEGPNYANDASDVWVTETEASLYNVYSTLNLTQTSQYKFVFWVRARDDGYVPDPTPSFAQFWVYEAKFENSVMVVDETGYTLQQGRWAPRDMDTAKAYFYNVLHDDMGYDDFDTIYQKDPLTGAKNYFYSATRMGNGHPTPKPDELATPKLINVLSHKVIIYYNDDIGSGPHEGPEPFGYLGLVFQGLDMGASGWLMSRNTGGAGTFTPRGQEFGKSANFAYRFGIQSVVCEGFQNGLFEDIVHPVFTEEFIGAYSNIDGFPNIMVNLGRDSLLDTRYPRWMQDTAHVMTGQPETGVGTRTQYAAALYLYLSKDGDLSMFHGKVMSVIQQLGDMRTACFMFTPLAMDPTAMGEVFQIVMPWLSAKFDESAKSSVVDIPNYNTAFSSIPERRARIAEFLRYMSEDATPEERAAYGMELPPPFKVTPTNEIIE